ncbi:PREDICTED: cyclic AMP-responsive element-binding protein 3-like, partial [Leptosomus discolor]|uniref:cyclic AMP-responsive element-binding protein 3-like n=1 Tax=Leptosomus discolor TaxID=188344 RepID=UPI0005223B37
MSCLEELAALANENLLDFLLKDDASFSETLGKENDQLEDWDLSDLQCLDNDMDEFISSLLSSFGAEPGILEGLLPDFSDSIISEDQNLSHIPDDFSGSPQSSDIVQADHNYSLHQDQPVLESMRSGMAEGDISSDLGTWMGLEGASKVLEQSSSFPIADDVDAGPQLVPEATVQSSFPELVLTEEERQLLEEEGVSLPTCLPLTEAEERLLKKVRQKIQNKQSAQDSHPRKKIYLDGLESRVADCTAQNHRLEKKVQQLQKRNTSLLKQLRTLQAVVRQSTTKTTTVKTCTILVVLSFCLILSLSICSFGNREPQLEPRGLSQQAGELPNQVAPDVQEDAALEGFSPKPEDPLLSCGLSQSWEEERGLSNLDPRSFNSNSSSSPLASAGSELGPPQPQEQCSQSDPLQAVVLAESHESG